MQRSESRRAPGGIPIYLIDGVEHRTCAQCDKLIKYEKQVRFCLACTLKNLKARKNRIPQITYKNKWPYRSCSECNQLFKYQPEESTCIVCSSNRSKRRRNWYESGNFYLAQDIKYGARNHDQPRPEHFEDKPMKGLFEGIKNPKLKEAMVRADFKAFMRETN